MCKIFLKKTRVDVLVSSIQSGSCKTADSFSQNKKPDHFLGKIVNLFRRCLLWFVEFWKSLWKKESHFEKNKEVSQVVEPEKIRPLGNWQTFKKNPIQFGKDHPFIFIGILALYSLKGIAVLWLGYRTVTI